MSRSTTNHAGYTRKQATDIINAYLLNCILSPEQWADEYGITCTSDKDRINAVVADFNENYYVGYTVKRYPNLQEAFAQFMQGQPHVISVDYWKDDIIQLAVNWGAIPATHTDRQAAKITENWYNYISFKFWQLHRKLNK